MTVRHDPNELIVREFGGKTFKASRRTFAHLDYTAARLKKTNPEAYIRVIQGCYSNGKYSAGTHDFDRVLDVEIVGMGWWEAQWFLRSCGWAAWYRYTGTWASESNWHIHMISLGATTKTGIFVDGGKSQGKSGYTSQIDDYYRHTLGLSDQHNTDLDKSRFPGDKGAPPWPVGTPEQWRRDIDATIFDFALWEQELEDAMSSPKDWDKEDWKAFAENGAPLIAEAVAEIQVGGDGDPSTLRQAINQIRNKIKKMGGGS